MSEGRNTFMGGGDKRNLTNECLTYITSFCNNDTCGTFTHLQTEKDREEGGGSVR